MSQPDATSWPDLLRQQESLRAVVESIGHEPELRPLLTRIVRHACELLGAENGTIGLVNEPRGLVRTEAAYRMPPGELGTEMAPGVGLMGQILLTRRAQVLNRYGDVAQPTQAGLLEYAVIGVPIFWHGRLIGGFGLGSPPPRRFTERDVDVLAEFATYAAIAIGNARLFEAERRRAARVLTINRIGRLITSRLSLEQLLPTAIEALSQHFADANIALLLVDPDDPRTLVLSARSGIYADSRIGEYRQSVADGVIGAAARARRPVLVDDVRQDRRYIPVPGAPTIQSELAVPLVVGDALLGVLNIESERRFSPEDAEGFTIVADQLSVAVHNASLFTRMQRALEETQVLYATSQRIGMAMDVDDVVGAYLEQVAARGRYVCAVLLYELDAAGRRAANVVRGRWTPDRGVAIVRGERLPHAPDALDPALDAGETVTIADVQADERASPELRQLQARDRRPAVAMIPLMARGQRLGLIVLSHSQVRAWRDADLRLYQVTAAQLATAIDSRRQHLLLAERGQQLAVLEERQRLARDLHDSVTQLLFSLTLIAQAIAPAWRREPAEGERRVQRVLELSHRALAEMRALLTELRPPETGVLPPAPIVVPAGVHVRREGLVAALRDHVAELCGDGLRIAFETGGYVAQPGEQEEALFRIAQEALNNVVKHARAGRVAITLATGDEWTRLTIRDDGVGFRPGSARAAPRPGDHAHGGLGLATMRERAEALGGTCRVTASPGRGTTVEVVVPRKDVEK